MRVKDSIIMANTNTSHFLIILPRQLGDILLGSSVVFALRQSFPDATITWVAHPMGQQLLNGHPAIDTVLYHPVLKSEAFLAIMRSPFAHLKKRFLHLKEEIRFLRQLRNLKCDTVIDVICTPRTALMTHITSAQNRIGIKTRWNRNWAYNRLVETHGWGAQYAATARLKLLDSVIHPDLCNNPPSQWLQSWIPSNDKISRRVDAWMNEVQLSRGQFVLLSPTHRRPLRRWPVENYAKLAALIIKHFNEKIVWLWGPGEHTLAESAHQAFMQIDPQADGQSLVPPLFSLPEVADLSGRCSVWIGNSNGLSHVAMAGGARTIQIHGPTHSEPWTHPNISAHTSVQRSEGCTRCESNICKQKTHECMSELDVLEVFEKYKAFRTALQS